LSKEIQFHLIQVSFKQKLLAIKIQKKSFVEICTKMLRAKNRKNHCFCDLGIVGFLARYRAYGIVPIF